jgi:hypothetical protein
MRPQYIPIFGVDLQALAQALSPLIAKDLFQFMPVLASHIARQDGQAISLVVASKMAKCRTGHVLQALQSGVLKGRRSGRRWLFQAGDVAAWIRAGRPI